MVADTETAIHAANRGDDCRMARHAGELTPQTPGSRPPFAEEGKPNV